VEEHLPKLAKTNASDQKSMLEKPVLPEWKNRKVADITPTDVDRLLAKIAAGRARQSKKKPTQKRRKKLAPPKPTPVRANRVAEMLRKMFNLAMLRKMRTDNPAFAFRRRPEIFAIGSCPSKKSNAWQTPRRGTRTSRQPASSASAC
jgi:hypothetical protein